MVRKATTISAPLDEPLPIMLTYQTAWVDGAGVVNFRAVIYDLDGTPVGQMGTAEAPAPWARPGRRHLHRRQQAGARAEAGRRDNVGMVPQGNSG